MPKSIDNPSHKKKDHRYHPYTKINYTNKYRLPNVSDKQIVIHQSIEINCCNHDPSIEINFKPPTVVEPNNSGCDTTNAEKEIKDLTSSSDINTDDVVLENAGVKDTNTEYGVCCFCLGECNPCSQACGRCARSRFY